MIDDRVGLVLDTGMAFKESELMETDDNMGLSKEKSSDNVANEDEDYLYQYDYIYFEDDIEVGQLLIRGKSIYHKSGRVCQTIGEVEQASHESINEAFTHDTDYKNLKTDAIQFKRAAEMVADELLIKKDQLTEEAFTEILAQGGNIVGQMQLNTEPLQSLKPVAEDVFTKAEQFWNDVKEDFPTPVDTDITEMVDDLEFKIGHLRDLLVRGQTIENEINDIGNQQDGYIKLVTKTQVETSMLIIDTNTLLKDMVRVTNETANLIKTIVEHSSKLGQHGKDVAGATELLKHPKYRAVL